MMGSADLGIDLSHHRQEFIEVDASISVPISIFDDLVHLCLREMFANAGSSLLELTGTK
jgi:hypothetical protein